MNIIIDADDAALGLKQTIISYLTEKGYQVQDLDYAGHHPEALYPDIGYNLARKVAREGLDRGILLCGTGLGMAMIANKVQGVFAGVCHDPYSASRLRASNNAQIITMGARVVGEELAKSIIDAWLDANYAEGSRSAPKIDAMRRLEHQSFKPEGNTYAEAH